MFEIFEDIAGCLGRHIFTHIKTFTGVLRTYQDIEVVLFSDIELVVQRIGGSPVPTHGHVLVDLVCGSVVTGIIDLVFRQVGFPRIGILLVADLTSINQTLDGLNLQIADSTQVEALALVVTALAVYHVGDRVAGVGVVVEPTFRTRSFQIVVHEVIAILIVNRNQRVGTQHIGNIVRVLVTNLNTLVLTMLVVNILTHLDDIHVSLAPQHMLGVQAEGETAEVRSNGVTECTILVLVAQTGRELGELGTSGNVEGMVRNHRVLVADGFQPVGTGIAAILISGQQIGIDEA